jgi:hypothetical protein
MNTLKQHKTSPERKKYYNNKQEAKQRLIKAFKQINKEYA